MSRAESIPCTAADPWGNLAMDEEAIVGEVLPIAQAAKTCGGLVLAQVKRLLDHPLPPQRVRVPGVLVDRLVLAQPHEHEQTFLESFNPAYCEPPQKSVVRHSLSQIHDTECRATNKLPPGVRRIIAARACDELRPGDIVNLGIGMPEGIARIAAERGLLQQVTLTVESGPIGGMPAGGLSFGAAVHPQAIIDQPSQFDFYDGGGLDFAALGAAQIDAVGNVNVSRCGTRFAGVGGFVNISQSARRLVFGATFTSGNLEIAIENNRLHILREGQTRKFVHQIEQLCFHAPRACHRGQKILYITERAVFQSTEEGLELIELAPGIDLHRDVLNQMDFHPQIRQLKPMPDHVFA